jgi:hypothetical protein
MLAADVLPSTVSIYPEPCASKGNWPGDLLSLWVAWGPLGSTSSSEARAHHRFSEHYLLSALSAKKGTCVGVQSKRVLSPAGELKFSR